MMTVIPAEDLCFESSIRVTKREEPVVAVIQSSESHNISHLNIFVVDPVRDVS